MSIHQSLPLFKQPTKPEPSPFFILTEHEKIAWIQLLRSRRVGVSTFFRLLREHGSAENALKALPDIAKNAGVKSYTPCPQKIARDELTAANKHNATMIHWGSAQYPKLLSQIPDPPPFLWAIGDTDLLSAPALAIVGARNASSLGLRMTRRLSKELAEQGFCIVSGLARGIDAAAHQAALEVGHSIAVMAGGLDRPYPRENENLFRELTQTGLVISERPFGHIAQAKDFPRRNRMISGLSPALIVIEAAAKSGSLITAKNALDQGREVLAVPGHPFDARASGCNHLIRDGAALIRNSRDIIDALPHTLTQPETQPEPADIEPELPKNQFEKPPQILQPQEPSLEDIAKLHEHILNHLGPSPLCEDELIRDISGTFRVGLDTILPELLQLELEGKIIRQAGGALSKPV